MTPRRYVVWTLGHWLVLLGGLALFVVVAALLQVATFDGGYNPPRWPAWFAPVAWCYGNLRLWQARRAYAGRIKWTTRQGVWVLPGVAESWLRGWGWPGQEDRQVALADAIASALLFWSDRYMPSGEAAIRDYLNGTALEVVVRDEPLNDRQHGIIARGLTYPKRISVQVTHAELAAGGAALWALVRHEVGHACLNALNVPQVSQHQVMKDAGFPDA